jgi:hypothetical protein
MILEFEMDGRDFRAEKLSAMKQLHLSRRVAPLLPPLSPLIVEAQKRLDKTKQTKTFGVDDIMALVDLAQPFADAIAAMEDKDAEKIFLLTLTSVKVRTSDTAWMPLWIEGANRPSMIELEDLGALLPIVIRVIVHNLGNFINALLTRHEGVSQGSSGEPSPVAKIG